MKISHLMLTVTAVLFTWLTAAYLRPVPTNSYQQASVIFADDSQDIAENELATLEGTELIK